MNTVRRKQSKYTIDSHTYTELTKKLNNCSKIVSEAITNDSNLFFSDLVHKRDNKLVFNYFKSLRKQSTHKIVYENNGKIIQDDQSQAELFNNYFNSVYTHYTTKTLIDNYNEANSNLHPPIHHTQPIPFTINTQGC